jgi:hypothetical protein
VLVAGRGIPHFFHIGGSFGWCSGILPTRMKDSPENPTKKMLDRFETAVGRDIPNSQELAVMDAMAAEARWETYRRRFPPPRAYPRTTEPTGIYNCHGFVFAASRTGIDYGSDVRMILKDDGYVQVTPAKSLPGDVVLYVANGDVEHSAILVTPEHLSVSTQAVVMSKWGPFTEWVHDVTLCPYDATNIEYWRIDTRPRPIIEIAR